MIARYEPPRGGSIKLIVAVSVALVAVFFIFCI